MRIAALTAGLAMIVGGVVAYRARARHDDRFETAMRTFERFTDEMCACKDNACAQHVSDDMTKWSMAMAKEWEPAPKLSDAEMQRATKLGERMGECMQKAMTGPELAQ